MASRGALLHFGGGIKSGGAILVLTKGPKAASEQEALCASAMVRNGVTACKTGRSRACEAMLKNQISGATDRTLPHALNFGLKKKEQLFLTTNTYGKGEGQKEKKNTLTL